MSGLHRQYERFHGKSPKRERQFDFRQPKGLVVLGDAVAVEYRCNKVNGGGDGRMATYRHKFEKGSVVCCDDSARRQLYILGPRIVVTSAGIEH